MSGRPAQDYGEFLARKHMRPSLSGISVDPSRLNRNLKDWQRLVTGVALRRGRCGLFEATGLGKTLQQLSWAEIVVQETGRPALILAPLAVAAQTCREAEKFGISVPVVHAATQADVPANGIAVTNYHKLQHFDASSFSAVVLDEAQILKSFMGKTKRMLCNAFASTPYKLACSATPAPNDYLEMGNQSQFLGVMDSDEMISRWFINDGSSVGKYRLKGHAADDYWRWVASWAVGVTLPSDLGFPDDGYVLPPLVWRDVPIKGKLKPASGALFEDELLTATTLQKERRETVEERTKAIADIIAREPDQPWIIWCHTNSEADHLTKLIPGVVEVRGSHSEDLKEQRLVGFSEGRYKRLLTKPRIAGFGMNWQHCRRMAIPSLNWSFEEVHQIVRRCWRFGQTEQVEVYVATTAADGRIIEKIKRSEAQHETMTAELRKHFAASIHDGETVVDLSRERQTVARLPQWLKSKECAA